MQDLWMDEFDNPRNGGKMDPDRVSASMMVGSPQVGAVIRLELEINHDVIVDARFKAYGAAAIACMSWLTQHVIGMTTQGALKVESMTLSQAMDIPSVKLYNCFLAVDALQLALAASSP